MPDLNQLSVFNKAHRYVIFWLRNLSFQTLPEVFPKMFRGSLVLIVAWITTISVDGQTKRLLFDKGHRPTGDSTKAVYYTIVEKLSDSAWYVKEYKIPNLIISSGTYIDQKMKIPDGKFIYYELGGTEDGTKIHFFAYRATVAYFSHGVKSGQWIDFYENGSKKTVSTYEKDRLNGLYQTYNGKDNIIAEGYYQNGLKQGEWCILGEDGFVNLTDIYEHGKKIKSIHYIDDLVQKGKYLATSEIEIKNYDISGNLIKTVKLDDGTKTERIDNAHPDFDFNSYLAKKVLNDIKDNTQGIILCQFWVNRDGTISELQISRNINDDVDLSVNNAIMNSPLWKPARQNNKVIDQLIHCSISIQNLTISAQFGSTIFDVFKR
ncbi:MAG: hypothetical protein M3N14_10385 [Bacteroidota bacterium]|nr:hypothetical protein [Bacteroidota bacterium]